MKSLLDQIDQLRKEADAQCPLDDHLRGQIKEYYRIGLTYTSNALEGNTLTETETKIILEEGITIGGKRLVEHFEAIGHSEAYDFLYTRAQDALFAEDDVRKLHRLFYYRIDEKYAGVYRDKRVFITGSKHALPEPNMVPQLVQEFISGLGAQHQALHPVEFAARVHKDFVFIHPFVDGNGRVARLLMNLCLLQNGYNIALIPPVVRSEYIRSLEKAHTDERDFVELIARMVKEAQQDYLRLFAHAQ